MSRERVIFAFSRGNSARERGKGGGEEEREGGGGGNSGTTTSDTLPDAGKREAGEGKSSGEGRRGSLG